MGPRRVSLVFTRKPSVVPGPPRDVTVRDLDIDDPVSRQSPPRPDDRHPFLWVHDPIVANYGPRRHEVVELFTGPVWPHKDRKMG